MISVGSLFAGIGGIDLAMVNAGFSIRWQVEKDEFCQQVLAKHFPDAERYGDIYECHNLPSVDVITAGFPCQPFSLAGQQRGREDERFLVPEMMRVIDECKPKLVLLENVPGFASLNDGDEFKQLLGAFAKMGFDAEWGHLRASDAGAPHRRERWFCVLSHTQRIRRDTGGIDRPEVFWGKRDRGIVPPVGEGDTLRDESDSVCGVRETVGRKLGDPDGKRFQGDRTVWEQESYARFGKESSAGTGDRDGQGTAVESRLGGFVYGIPYRVDGHRFPNWRGLEPHGFEPPRTTARKDLRRQRVTALGNAVVPQVIYPIAVMMMAKLREGTFCDG